MTYNDIYIKFLIEYDKANITSSYPALTKYEIATILDKAYLALISQKFTGNNPRKVSFEGDVKAIEDLRGLLTSANLEIDDVDQNVIACISPSDLLYYVDSTIQYTPHLRNGANKPADDRINRPAYIELINQQLAKKFLPSKKNLPWIQNPVGYFTNDNYFVVIVDSYELYDGEDFTINHDHDYVYMTYIRKPEKFVDYYDKFDTELDNTDTIDFLLNDYMAEELINLAIVMVAETVESTRQTTKSQLIPLES